MIEEIGIVTSTEGRTAHVNVPKKSTCEGCTAGTCTTGEQSMEIIAFNKAGAETGQKVKVLIHSSAYMKGAIIVYGIPALALVAGAVFGKEFMPALFIGTDPDILSAQAFDAAAMVCSLLKDHKDTPLAVRDGLLALQNYAGISGSATFAGSGEAQKKLFLIKIEDGKFTLLGGGK